MRKAGVFPRLFRLCCLAGILLVGGGLGGIATAGTHYVDLRPATQGPGKFVTEGSVTCYRVLKGQTVELYLRDSEGHHCAIFGVDKLNTQYTVPPDGWGVVRFPATCTRLRTEVQDQILEGICLETYQSTPLEIRVVEIEMGPDPASGGDLEVLQNTSTYFSVVDALNHNCCIFGFDTLNPEYVDPPYVPSGQGSAGGWAFITEPGQHTLNGFCLQTYNTDPLNVQVLPVDLKPDRGSAGFVQAVKGQTVVFELYVQGGHLCGIFGLDKLSPAYQGYVPKASGYVSAAVVCTIAGAPDKDIMGYDYETAESDWTLVRVSQIVETKFETAGGSPLDANPQVGGGKRIFPEWLEADLPNGPLPAERRRWVQAHSRVEPPPTDRNQPIAVRFTYYDVDDPSANEAPVDDETDVADNRGDLQHHWQTGLLAEDAPVTTLGDAATILVVSHQPGDNYRVNAQLGPGLYGAPFYGCMPVQGVADGRLVKLDGQPVPAQEVTEMLTVWRRLHVEHDSMAEIPYGSNAVYGFIGGVTWLLGGLADVDLGLNLPDTHDDQDQFAFNHSGTLNIPGIVTITDIKSSTAYWFSNDHLIVGDVVPPQVVGEAYDLVDDDKAVLPRLPDLGLMAERFRPAYVEPVAVAGTDLNASFHLNLEPSGSAINSVCDPVRDQPCNTWYWSAQVVGSFQGDYPLDSDGAGESGGAGGGTPMNFWGTCLDRSVIFLELCDDMSHYSGSHLLEQTVVVHEVGHQLQCQHSDGGVMAPEIYGGEWFTPWSLCRIRFCLKPGE